MLSTMLLAILMVLFSTLGVIGPLICGNRDSLKWGRKLLFDFNVGKSQLSLFDI